MQTIIQKTLEDTMYLRTIPLLIYKINYPHFSTTCNPASARSINQYYRTFAEKTEVYCRNVLFPQAAESAGYITDNRPFNSFTLDVNYKITYNKGCIVSLFMDTYTYMGGAHGETKRTSDTWDFNTGIQLSLWDICPDMPRSLYILEKYMEMAAAGRLKEAPGSYFDNYKSLLQKSFNPQSFYLLPDSFVIYYQQYDIAPYAAGLPEFTFPMRSYAEPSPAH